MIRAFHRTSADSAAAILRDGFRDATGTYMTSETHHGVWITRDAPWSLATGGLGQNADALVVVGIPDELFAQFEWVDEMETGYREALIPAADLNRHPRWLAWECAECERVDRCKSDGWQTHTWANPLSGKRESCHTCPDCTRQPA